MTWVSTLLSKCYPLHYLVLTRTELGHPTLSTGRTTLAESQRSVHTGHRNIADTETSTLTQGNVNTSKPTTVVNCSDNGEGERSCGLNQAGGSASIDGCRRNFNNTEGTPSG